MANENTEVIYLKSKELRQMVRENVVTSFSDDSDLKNHILKLSTDIPMHIGKSFKINSLDEIIDQLKFARNKLAELCTGMDLIKNEYFKFDETKFNDIVNEIAQLIPQHMTKAEEAEQRWLDEIMNEFYIDESTETKE